MTAPNETMSENQPISDRSYPEDFALENGYYSHRCPTCSGYFDGHKSRVICKLCAAETPPAANASERYPAFSFEVITANTCGFTAVEQLKAVTWYAFDFRAKLNESMRELADARERLSVLDKQVRQLDQFGSAWKANAEARAEEIERLRGTLSEIRNNPKLWKSGGKGGQDQYAGLPPMCRLIDKALAAQNPVGDGAADGSGV